MHRDQLPIAEPCHADWSAMSGTACKRFCGECELHVHDLSAMTERRAKRLLASGGGRICVRYTTGADGRILHRKAPWARAVAVAAALFSATPALAAPAPATPTQDDDAPTVIERLTKAVLDWVAPAEEEVVISTGQVQVKMGEVEPDPPKPPSPVRMGKVAPDR